MEHSELVAQQLLAAEKELRQAQQDQDSERYRQAQQRLTDLEYLAQVLLKGNSGPLTPLH